MILIMTTLGLATANVDEPCDDLKRDMIALELFLQDQEDHPKFCPEIKWDQPDIEVYKKTLKSQLPENCIK
jgi:hypothetical protein